MLLFSCCFIILGISSIRPDLVYGALLAIYKIEIEGLQVGFIWFPAHAGISGNEFADQTEKGALNHDRIDVCDF